MVKARKEVVEGVWQCVVCLVGGCVESLCMSHGYPLLSTVTNFYISLHCFIAKCLIQMFKNVHGLK